MFLAGDFVYKVKKPVDLGFLDFTTLERRRHFCQEEVRLNRRLCADTYLGVVPIVEGGGVAVEGRGTAVDYAVKMRRLPEERMMGRLLEEDAVTPRWCAPWPGVWPSSTPRRRRGRNRRFGGLAASAGTGARTSSRRSPTSAAPSPPAGPRPGRMWKASWTGGERCWSRGSARAAIRDCHGDLRAEAVCFSDGVCIFDCIEFNQRFRYSDVAADLGFLAMDLDYRGRPDMSERWCGLRLGGGRPQLLVLMDFYKCYRAYVRGKVEGFLLTQPEVRPAERRRSAGRPRAPSSAWPAATPAGAAGPAHHLRPGGHR